MKKIIHIIISVVYILWGIGAPLTLIKQIASLDFSSLLSIGMLISVVTGLIMFFAGIFGLLRIRPLKRRILGVIILILAALGVMTSVLGGGFSWQALVQAIMALLYIIW